MKKFLILSLIIAGCGRSPVEVKINDKTPPSPPSGLTVYFAGDGMIILIWNRNKEADIAGYKIYRTTDTTLGFMQIAKVDETSFTDKNLNYDSTYFYYVTAFDLSGNESRPSSIVSGKPVNRTPPVRPVGLYVEAHNDLDGVYIYLSWLRNPDGDIKGYKIFRDEIRNFEPTDVNLIGFTNNNFFIDTSNLKVNRRYFYRITAVDMGDFESQPSNSSGDIILEKPRMIHPEDKAIIRNSLKFKWIKVENANGYVLTVSTSKYGNEIWKKIINNGSISGDTITLNYQGPVLLDGRRYYWKVATFSIASDILNSISETREFIINRYD
jgi:fibronectin type 3 domain-containing protein